MSKKYIADEFVVSGGTSSDFLRGDGTLGSGVDDSNLVHKTGTESIAGLKTFTDKVDIDVDNTSLELTSTGTVSNVKFTNSSGSATAGLKNTGFQLAIGASTRFFVDSSEISLENSTVGVTPQTATGDGTTTIDWTLGNFYHLQMGAQTETVTFTNPTKAGVFKLKVTQPATGGLLRTANLPTTIKWVGGNKLFYTNGNSAVDIADLYFDGTDWFGEAKADFKIWAI